MNISEAKNICRAKHGHLPKMGYEMLIEEGERSESVWLNSTGGLFVEGNSAYGKHLGDRLFKYCIWLVNESGNYRIREWSGPR